MPRRRVASVSAFIGCAVVGIVPGCGTEPSTDETTAALTEPAAPAVTPACAVAEPAVWTNQSFPDQARRFHVEFDVTPSTSSIDAVVGLSDGSAASFSQLAGIVRFNPSGTIDVRAGDTYRADTTWRYQAGQTFRIRIDLDVRDHTYSVWIGNTVRLARLYAFRTEQATAPRLNNLASVVDSTTGTLQVCGLTVVADATTADGCVVAAAGDGFVDLPQPTATVLDTLWFNAEADRPDIDAVVGQSAGVPDAFSDLATAVRFAPSGKIDARNGDTYRVDNNNTYGTTRRSFEVISDLTSHTYSVYYGTSGPAFEVARQYKFRTEQRSVAQLDHLAAIVDSPAGNLTLCPVANAPSVGVVYSREGIYSVAPLPNNEALISGGTTTTRVDANGQVIATLAAGGEITTDALGNIFVVNITGGFTLTVDKFAPDFAPLWRATQAVPGSGPIQEITTDSTGAVIVGIANGNATAFRFTADGTLASTLEVPGEAISFDGDQVFVAWQHDDTLQITQFDIATGATVWTRAFDGRAQVTAMTTDPAHNVLFGGELITPIDFGGGLIPLRSNPDRRLPAFVVKLSPGGDHVFSQGTGDRTVNDIATNGPRIVVAATYSTQFNFIHLLSLDANGAPGPAYGTTGFGGSEQYGSSDRIWMGTSGRVWANQVTRWPGAEPWPYMVALDE